MELLKERVVSSKRFLKNIEIPAIPESILRLEEIYSRKIINSCDVVNIIKNDSTLSGELIKTVNSKRFGFKIEVESVAQAVEVIGAENPQLVNILKSSALKSLFRGSEQYEAVKELLEQCSDIAHVSYEIAKEVLGFDPHQAYTLGLFMDIGYLLLSSKDPRYIKSQITSLSNPYKAVKQEVTWGADHVTVGFIVSNYWHLPKWMQHAILLHHDDISSLSSKDYPQRVLDGIAICKITSFIVAETSFGCYTSSKMKEEFEYASWFLGIDESIIGTIRKTYIVDMFDAEKQLFN